MKYLIILLLLLTAFGHANQVKIISDYSLYSIQRGTESKIVIYGNHLDIEQFLPYSPGITMLKAEKLEGKEKFNHRKSGPGQSVKDAVVLTLRVSKDCAFGNLLLLIFCQMRNDCNSQNIFLCHVL